ncbi:MAG: FHA domain-containing protein [Pseudomonadota bacterium]
MIDYPVRFRVQMQGKNGADDAPGQMLECPGPGSFSFGKSDEADIKLDGDAVSRRHFTLVLTEKTIQVRDDGSTNGTSVNGERVAEKDLAPGDKVTIPGWEFELMGEGAPAVGLGKAPSPAKADTPVQAPVTIFNQNPGTGPQLTGIAAEVASLFGADQIVSMSKLRQSGYDLHETRFCAVGGGLGSFVFVDHLRCYGVPASAISVIGTESVPHETYKRYCRASQIPDHERLRSNSLSRPDNIWGFPGYALRELGRRGYVKGIVQVFGEPAIAESYTPRAGDVYDSVSVEAKRIRWSEMFRQGQARGLRKTDDGRYVVAYQPRSGDTGDSKLNLVVADVIHLSTGYPATRFVEDFQVFLAKHPTRQHLIANAYDVHHQIYEDIERRSDDVYVVVRGRGIVASRIIQRLSEARAKNPRIKILHSIRSEVKKGAVYGRAKRPVKYNVEIQPFNWPKSCWSGDLRFEYERADDERRGVILTTLGGTSTAERSDWLAIARDGGDVAQGQWYKQVFGSITRLEPDPTHEDQVQIDIRSPDGDVSTTQAHYLIDCTGLIADIRGSKLLADLLDTYSLPRNYSYRVDHATGAAKRGGPTGLKVTNDFEIEAMRNQRGRVYAAGTITTGGPYLAVDSFLGLQYSALRAVDHLVTERMHGVSNLNAFRSFGGWVKWFSGAAP